MVCPLLLSSCVEEVNEVKLNVTHIVLLCVDNTCYKTESPYCFIIHNACKYPAANGF